MSPTTSKYKGKLGGTASPVVSGSEKYMKQLQSPSVRKLFSENQTVQNLQVIHNLKKNYRHRKLFEIWAFVVAIVGLVLMLAENEVLMVADASSTPLSEALKTVVSISTAILLILIVCRYQSHTNIYKLQNIIPPTASMLSVFWPVLLLELIVCGFHIPPYLSGSLPILQFRHSLDSNENAICRHPKNLTTTIHDNACYLSYSYNYDTSVGYGDYAPVTYAGRGFLTCSGILGGLLILSLVQSIFFGALELTDNESRVKYIIDKTRWDKQRREAAVKLIQTQYRLKRQLHPRNGPVNQRAVDHLSLHLFECMEAMHKFVRGEPRNARTFEEEMDGHIGSLLRAMDDMKRDEDAILQRIQDKTRRLHAACDDILASTM
ncbi:hypothetical protein DYB32_007020 [Aphanomyces invadans]|uniref:Potassium channel domain-containing protein n=1 Tax=Aphanomyces invadans TaxID=157072 RepID=A0A418APX3_9STRA|nr:hypothetical protein DYB32_007020 [Aphanomyces invadans]